MLTDFAAIDLDLLLAEAAAGTPAGPRLLSVGSGSRGSGKTTLSWLLALTLARADRRTVLLDSDLAAAGLYGRHDATVCDRLLQRFLQKRGEDINILPCPTSHKNLFLITGSPSVHGHAQLSLAAKQKILLQLRRLQCDYVVIDSGEGPSYHHLDLFLAADLSIVVARIPDSSLLESYQFIRYGFFRKIQHRARFWPELFNRLSLLGDLSGPGRIETIPDLILRQREMHHHLCAVIEEGWAAFQPNLIVNRVQKGMERRRVEAMGVVVREALGITLTEWGEVREDGKIHPAQTSADLERMLHSEAGADMAGIVERFVISGENAGLQPPVNR
jgi:flagellar biosynthesis protein FlhG